MYKNLNGKYDMGNMTGIIVRGLQIILINLVLSVDNVGVIALTIRDLPYKSAVLINKLGILAALLLRIVFVVIVGFLFKIDWLPINIIGGGILLIITFQMLQKPKKTVSMTEQKNVTLFSSLFTIILADISMSFDNIFAMASIALGDSDSFHFPQILLLMFGLAICFPILFWGSGLIIRLMKKYPIIIYLCSGILTFSGVKMILQENFIKPHIHAPFDLIIELLSGTVIIFYGYRKISRKNKVNILSILETSDWYF
jgi:YjbE family integral membrane protein